MGSPELTWQALLIFVEQLPIDDRESAFRRSLDPKIRDRWSFERHLLASLVDLGAIANWQRTEDGAKGRNRPEPVPRPDVEDSKRRKGAAVLAGAEEWKRRQDERRRRAEEKAAAAAAKQHPNVA